MIGLTGRLSKASEFDDLGNPYGRYLMNWEWASLNAVPVCLAQIIFKTWIRFTCAITFFFFKNINVNITATNIYCMYKYTQDVISLLPSLLQNCSLCGCMHEDIIIKCPAPSKCLNQNVVRLILTPKMCLLLTVIYGTKLAANTAKRASASKAQFWSIMPL